MNRTKLVLALLAGSALALALAANPGDAPPARTPWTASRVVGSPEPPPPYRVERTFPKLAFRNPLLMTAAPGTERLFVGEQAGLIVSFPNDPSVAKADPFLDLAKDVKSCQPGGGVKEFGALYGLTFHPKFAENRYCYVCYIVVTPERKALNAVERLARFTVSKTDPPRCDPASEKILLTWATEPGGHNGGCLCFGPDGYLYVSMGDAAPPSPPDMYDTGQDISDLLSSVLRIDVDREENGKPYAVPKDNPFVGTPNARPEVWAFGFRNPWKMSFDRATGDLWVGDVGWELWELVFRVRKGGNYGWSVKEGRQWVRPDAKRGPTPILPPALDFPHTEGASVTGGFVYHGRKFPDLVGSYVCGDWMTSKVWATRFAADDRILSHQEIAQGSQKIVAFAEDHRGELYFLDYAETGGGIYQLAPNPAVQTYKGDFPKKLSQTGLFADVKELRPAPGVYPFAVNAAQWQDHATAERFVGLPGTATVKVYDEPIPVPGTAFYSARVFFPKDGVLARTAFLELERGSPASRRRVETQLLHYDGEDWRGYTYQWNDDQTDATLVPAGGAQRVFAVTDREAPGGKRKHTWRFPSRGECRQCHNPWAGTVLAFTAPQLDVGDGPSGQWERFRRLGLVTPVDQKGQPKPADASARPPKRLADPLDARQQTDDRARAYLHANCSHCHQPGAGGTAQLDFRFDVPLEQTRALDERPVQGVFDLADARLLAPGDPYRSVVYYRMAKLGPGRMPHIGSEFVDERGLALVHDWIAQLPGHKDERLLLEKLCRPTAGRFRPAEQDEAIGKLLATPAGALMLVRAIDTGRVAEAVRPRVIAAATARAGPTVRDLFERFVPDEQRVKRLGPTVAADMILNLKGDAARGKEVFFKTAGLRCADCHRVGATGGAVGPDLSQIGKKYTRAKILENILEPSKEIDPKYVTYHLETTDGKVLTGVLVSKTDAEVVLRDAQDKELRVPAAKVAGLAPSKQSLMPEQLLRDLTAEQAADLLAFLESLK